MRADLPPLFIYNSNARGCKSLALFHMGRIGWMFFLHWHTGKGISEVLGNGKGLFIKDGFRMRESEFLNKSFKIPFLRYEVV